MEGLEQSVRDHEHCIIKHRSSLSSMHAGSIVIGHV